jgi:lipopolysaccharide transport system permease protein
MWIIIKLQSIAKHHELILSLVQRDLKARYKVSVLGFLWSLLRPLFMMVVFTVVFSRIFRWDIRMDAPYPLFLLTAILPWQFLTNSVSASANVLLANESLIKKVYLPREVFPLSIVLSELINFLLSLVVLLPFLWFFHISVTGWLLLLPLVLLIEVILVTGLCLLVSSLNVFFRDTLPIVDLGIMAWFYLSPIFYPVYMVQDHLSPKMSCIYMINPITPIITGFRKAFLASGFRPDSGFGYYGNELMTYLAIAFGISVIVLLIGWRIFYQFDNKLADTL